jgi:hypothetical protein
MLQTRAEAASLVVQLQRTAVTQGLMFYGIAAVTGLAFMTAVIVWIAVEAPPSWRGWALGLITLALAATAVFSVVTAGRKLKHDAELIADFSRGVKLDLAMINLAIKDPDTEDEDKLAERERAKEKVREAAVDKATAPSTAEGGMPAPGGPAMESAAAAMRAAAPRPDVTPAGTAETDAAARAAPGATSTRAASASGVVATGVPDGDTSAPPSQTRAGYAFTGGGTYASTSPPAPVVEDHAMPEALANPGDVAPTAQDDDTERKQRHGSA